MDHEALLIGLFQTRTRIADHRCPWCDATDWSEGVLTAAAKHSINRDGLAAFLYAGGAPQSMLISAVFHCKPCGYHVSFALAGRETPVG